MGPRNWLTTISVEKWENIDLLQTTATRWTTPNATVKHEPTIPKKQHDWFSLGSILRKYKFDGADSWDALTGRVERGEGSDGLIADLNNIPNLAVQGSHGKSAQTSRFPNRKNAENILE
jgi:hypothetical protein